jgi:hypothetical protein
MPLRESKRRAPLLAGAVLGTAALLAAGAGVAEEPLGKLPPEPFVKEAPRESGFRCDGTDPFFFDELEKAGAVGYGETWDEHLCDEGVETYAEGATGRWKALRAPKRPPKASDEDQMLALVMPLFAIGGIGAIFLAASGLAAASRLRKRVILEVPCAACAAPLPIAVDDKSAHQLFCPMCGAANAVDVEGKGKTATATARLLG